MASSMTEITVRYAETDQMGIVHHSNYPIYFEAGRTDFIKQLGMPYSKIEAEGLLLPLIEMKCSFIMAAKYEDILLVKTFVKELTYTRVVFGYEVFKSGQAEPITVGQTHHVWTDRTLKPLNLKKKNPQIYALLSSAVS